MPISPFQRRMNETDWGVGVSQCQGSALLLCCAQNLSPTNISINGNPCSVQLNLTLSNVVPNDTSSGVSPLSESVTIEQSQSKVEQASATTVSGQYPRLLLVVLASVGVELKLS